MIKIFLDELSSLSFFKKLDKNQISKIFQDILYQVKEYKKGEIIFDMDDKIDSVGIILKGTINMSKILSNGKIIKIKEKVAGNFLGSGALFSKEQKISSVMLAESDTKIIFFKKSHFIKLISRDEELLNNYLSMMGNQIIFLNKKIELFSYCGIQERIAYCLLNIFNKNTEKDIITLPFTKKEWSEYLNVSRTSFFRELKKMSEDNIIKVDKNKLVILNYKELEKIIS